ncbi:MAG TPA: hypothetical protein DIT19_01255 [Desulfonauticus sp.]|nr:MAG: hypothetical protein XD41_1710 [Desulfonauticus sp. 38_4375]HCO11840.1 hypothetical protein [Desulfonauticus sp.]
MSKDDYQSLNKEIQDTIPVKKRLFIGLILLTSFLLCLLLVGLWVVPYVGLRQIHPLAPYVLAGLLGLIFIGIIWSSLGLVLSIILKKNVLLAHKIRGLTIKFFLPLMVGVGRIFNISKQKVRASFIKVNNELVLSSSKKYKPQEILLLLPHCLQNSLCDKRLTYNIYNCEECGKCPLAGLIKLHKKYGINIAIATGGTIARRIVVTTRPKMIIAVACERDLSSGIQDTYPLPVYGILNKRPKGPCLDTLVPLKQVEKALEYC